jgi:predicted Zn finger-like uncharacterized protein/prepilin-type processing-associated H-X9-DG protein
MTESNQIKCPHCGQSYAVRPDQWAQYNGRTINCTKCGQSFTVSAPSPAGTSETSPATGESQQPAPYPPPSVGYAVPPGVQPPGYGQTYAGPPTAGNGLAVTSLIFGLVGMCVPVIGGLVAIITGIIALTKTRDPRVGGKGMAIAGISLGGIGLFAGPVLISILLPALNHAREQANRIKCASNMRLLGQNMMMYANNNNGHFPDKLEDVLQIDPSIPPTTFVCPSDDKSPPSAASVQAEAHEISTGQHCSFIYVGKDLTTSASADTVLLYEPLTDHHSEGIYALFADGHVDWLKQSDARSVLDQQAAGKRPITVVPSP